MKKLRLNRNLIIGLVLTGLVVIPCIVGLFWLPYDVNVMDSTCMNKPPSLLHWFGTDNFGRDILSRVVEGAGKTFIIAFMTVLIGAAIGTVIGALTGYFGGIVDEILMRVNDALASFPSILLALVIVSLLDKGTSNIVIALGLVFIPSFARIMRSEFIAEKDKDYVYNARLMGAGSLRIIFLHILPNTMHVLLATALVGINNAILAEAGLSYMGLGVQPPDPSLGRMLAEAQAYMLFDPWYVITTGMYMIIGILGISLICDNMGMPAVNINKIKSRLVQKRRLEAARNADSHENEGTEANDTGMKGMEAHELTNAEKTGLPGDVCLAVNKLSVAFIEDTGTDIVLEEISFTLKRDEIIGVVGESGSGKSLTAMSIMGLLPEYACILKGSIDYNGYDLTLMSEEDYSRIRGREIAMIFQEPMTSLNPLLTIGSQIEEVLDLHFPMLSEEEHKRLVLDALNETGLHETENLYSMYPHQLSGGMRQRVVIAMALIAKAKIIIADEPTTALDAKVQEVIVELLQKINRKYHVAIIFVSHDLRLIESICDRALIMQDGHIVEELDVTGYTKVGSQKNCSAEKEVLSSRIKTRAFAEPVTEYGQQLLKAAFNKTKLYDPNIHEKEEVPLVRLRDFNVYYKNRNAKILHSLKQRKLKQVNFNINLDIFRGDTLGIVGESGCGKSTLVRAIAGLQKYCSGELAMNCRQPSMVFQDPYGSLNPVRRVGWILNEALKLNGAYTAQERRERVDNILEETELEAEYRNRRINELSGGQRQRVAIALSIILNRDLIILDEPVSALDVTIQEQILELLMKLKKEHDLAYIFISHDKTLVERVCNRVCTMVDGRLTENYREN